MKPPFDEPGERDRLRDGIIGMGETSLHKSYYPILQQRLLELERFRALIDETNEIILMVQIPGNRCIDVNHAASVQLGYSTEDLKALDIFLLVVPEKRGEFKEVFSRAAASGKQQKIETVLITSVNQRIPVELLIHFVGFGDRKYAVIVCRDISERQRYERELIAADKKLNLINTLTTTDIRSQVFIVRAYLDVLRQIAKHPDEISILEKLESTTDKIQSHLEFSENYQKLGAQTPRWQNFSEVLLYAVSHLPPVSVTRCRELVNLEICSDPLLEKGLTHLMEYLYTHGGISEPVRISTEKKTGSLSIRLEKTAPGIPANQKASLFVWVPAKTSAPNLFFIQEILEITGIVIEETGGEGTLCFEIRVPERGYRFL